VARGRRGRVRGLVGSRHAGREWPGSIRRGPGPAPDSGPVMTRPLHRHGFSCPFNGAARIATMRGRAKADAVVMSEGDDLEGEKRHRARATRARLWQSFAPRRPVIHLSNEQLIPAVTGRLRAPLPRKGPIALARLMRRLGWLLFYRGYQGVGTGSWAVARGLLACLAGPLPLSG
jgi:hypothetical protein